MFKVIIADDEKIVRIAMQGIINWQKHNFEIVGIAQDGEEVINMLEDKQPDLIITDLKMAKVNGIQLIEYLNNIGFKGKIIVLSNHGEYELVREAMKKGAMDYLLKVTLKSSELSELVKHVALSLKDRYEDEKKSELLKSEYIKNKNIAKISILKEYLQEELNDEYLKKKIKEFNIEIFNEESNLMYFIIDDYKKVYENQIKDKIKMANFILNIIQENVFNKKHEIIQINSHKYVIIINESKEVTKVLTESIQKSINLYMNFSVSAIISNTFKGIDKFKEKYSMCQEIVKYKFYGEKTFIIEEDLFNGFGEINNNIRRELTNNIKENLDNGDIYENINVMCKFIDECKGRNVYPDNIIKIIYFLLELIEEYEFSSNFLKNENLLKLKNSIRTCDNINDLKYMCNEVLDIINNMYILNREGGIKKEISIVIDFINKNIDKRITLMMVSKAVNMNESYLSRLFKNETGKNLMYFINEVKMEKARELLKKPNSLVKEVASNVGMQDQFYFNRVFKKFYGVSPSKFKKQFEMKIIAK
ncbi:response regulator transcription factor [Clostridium tarantellae]|uniref:Stage 0 sporulation protein A homolog n=1 Tax=Clostridium tarantellae TaxID=39493 RepID=A0A6I1MGR5_9CLOT|nr:response regulator [Clostridium tarantellae]MPQ42726.1 response regulator [Clostridium tarantellae]